MTAFAAATEPGMVALEWPVADIAPEFLRPEAHAALITVARREAERLGLPVGPGSVIVRRVGGPARGGGEARLRFVWAAQG